MNALIRSLVVAATMLSFAPLAAAQQACLPRDAAVAKLETQFAERAAGRGLATRGAAMVELFVAEAGGWTVIVTDPEGRACVVASGKDWFSIVPVSGEPA